MLYLRTNTFDLTINPAFSTHSYLSHTHACIFPITLTDGYGNHQLAIFLCSNQLRIVLTKLTTSQQCQSLQTALACGNNILIPKFSCCDQNHQLQLAATENSMPNFGARNLYSVWPKGYNQKYCSYEWLQLWSTLQLCIHKKKK